MGFSAVILLDTHAWVWAVDQPTQLSLTARQEISSQDLVLTSSISCWEIAMLVDKRRLTLSQDVERWILETLNAPGFEIIPLSATAARLAGSNEVAWPHADPADRMIVSTAIDLDIPLITADQTIRSIEGITTIW